MLTVMVAPCGTRDALPIVVANTVTGSTNSLYRISGRDAPSSPGEIRILAVSMCASCYYTSLGPKPLRTSPDTRSSSPPPKKTKTLRNDFSSCFFFTLRDASRDSRRTSILAGTYTPVTKSRRSDGLWVSSQRGIDKTGELGSSQSHVSVKDFLWLFSRSRASRWAGHI